MDIPDGPPQVPLSPAHLRCPQATDAWLRTNQPVRWVPEHNCWLVSSRELVHQVVSNHDTFSNSFGRVVRGRVHLSEHARTILAEGWPPRDTLFTVDPPVHRRHRSVVNRAFSAHRVAGLEAAIKAIAADLVRSLPVGRPVDIVPTLAVPLPMTVIGDQLGVPRDDLSQVKVWSDAVARELSGLVANSSEQEELSRQAVAFQRYFVSLVADRRRHPRNDVMSDLVTAVWSDPHGGDDHGFDDAEVLAFLQQFLVAGNETTTSAIAALIMRLAAEPELQAEVRDHPEQLEALVEEVLRLDSPIQAMWRVAKVDTELGGVVVAAGDLLLVRYLAANHDPDHHPTPEACRLDRRRPRDHLAFGAGIHFCAGAALARMEIRIAAEQLLAATSMVTPAWTTPPAHDASLLLHGLDAVEVTLRE